MSFYHLRNHWQTTGTKPGFSVFPWDTQTSSNKTITNLDQDNHVHLISTNKLIGEILGVADSLYYQCLGTNLSFYDIEM